MPKPAHSSDWELFFGPRAPRRKGPIALFVTMTLLLCFVALLGVGTTFGARRYEQYTVAQALTATPLWKEYYIQQTATAQAKAAPTPAPTAPTSPAATVNAVGNLRSEPRIAPQTVLGQLAAGDQVAVLEQQAVANATWYRVRVQTTTGALKAATEGWINGSLLTLP